MDPGQDPGHNPTAGRRAAWYPDPDDATSLRYWTGEEWDTRKATRTTLVQVETHPKGMSPDALIALGLLLGIVAGVIFGAGMVADPWGGVASLAVVLAVPGWVVLTVGLIGKGVQVGMREHRRDYG